MRVTPSRLTTPVRPPPFAALPTHRPVSVLVVVPPPGADVPPPPPPDPDDPLLPEPPPPPPAASATSAPAPITPPAITSVFVPRPPADCAVLEDPAPALPGAAPVLAIVTPSALKPLIDALASAEFAAAACSTRPPASRATPMITEPVGVLVAIIIPCPQSRRLATTRGA